MAKRYRMELCVSGKGDRELHVGVYDTLHYEETNGKVGCLCCKLLSTKK